MKIVIITGSSRGIGAAAIECCKRGMGVIVTYNINQQAAESVVKSIKGFGGTAISLKLDVTNNGSFAAFREDVLSVLKKVWQRTSFDCLVNNAGYGLFNPMEKVTEAEFDGLFNVHLKGPFFLTQTLLPLLTDGGQIINLTSATTRCAFVGVAPYAAFKGGLEVLTRYMAKEFAPRRIRANSISPGPIRTELGGGLNDEFEAMLASMTALGRVGEPVEAGSVIASLIGDENRWVNAQNIEVTGGYLI